MFPVLSVLGRVSEERDNNPCAFCSGQRSGGKGIIFPVVCSDQRSGEKKIIFPVVSVLVRDRERKR